MSFLVNIISLGCPKNQVDTETMLAYLVDAGYELTDEAEFADILLINTCGFIQEAKEESLNFIWECVKMKNQDEKKKIIVCGCLAQRYPKELWEKIPEIDGLLGINQLNKIEYVCKEVLSSKRVCLVERPRGKNKEFTKERLITNTSYAYLKISDGCKNFCSYCAIPQIRGSYRSRKMGAIIKEAENLAKMGIKEINLIGQDTTLYGADLYKKRGLPELLSRLSEIEGIKWIRLLYTHPAHYTDRLIETVASNKKICKYLDLPLQHISDKLLSQMNRKVNRKQIEALISKIRERIPGVTLRTTFIVGFPGEGKKHFDELVEFVKEIGFERVGVFCYSKEEDTKAYDLKKQVSQKTKQKRWDELMQIQKDISWEKNKKMIGEEVIILVDQPPENNHGFYSGRSEAFAPEVDGNIYVEGKNFKIGDLVKVTVTQAFEYDLKGKPVPVTIRE